MTGGMETQGGGVARDSLDVRPLPDASRPYQSGDRTTVTGVAQETPDSSLYLRLSRRVCDGSRPR